MKLGDSIMLSYYAARAEEYDDVYLQPERQAEFREIEKWLSPIFSTDRVLEIACGTGYWTKFIALTAASVVALDATPETINFAWQRVNSKNVQFVVGDAFSLPNYETNFDAAFAGFWFSHVPRQRWYEFMNQLFSKLKSGAKVLMLDSYNVDDNNSPTIDIDSDGNTFQRRVLDNGTAFSVLKNFPSQSELQQLAIDLDKKVTFNTWDSYWAFTYA